MSAKQHIVIVGGGYGGSRLATKLIASNQFQVTLIDGRDGMFHCIGALRAAVDKSYGNKLFIPYDKMVGESFKRGKAAKLNSVENYLLLENGDKVTYDRLVIATGVTSPFPGKVPVEITIEEALNRYNELRGELAKSNDVVVVGAGSVGVELSGEIKCDFPNKNVTLIASRDYLVTQKGAEEFRKGIKACLDEAGVNIVYNEHVSNLGGLVLNKHVGGQTVETEGGKRVEADLVLPCTGTRLNDGFYKDDLASSLDGHGLLIVDDFFKVEGRDNIYAIGDVTNVKEEKMAYASNMHADLLANNWTSTEEKKKYEPGPFNMMVPVGRNGGSSIFFGNVLDASTTAQYKSKDLFYQKIWTDVGVTPPSDG